MTPGPEWEVRVQVISQGAFLIWLKPCTGTAPRWPRTSQLTPHQLHPGAGQPQPDPFRMSPVHLGLPGSSQPSAQPSGLPHLLTRYSLNSRVTRVHTSHSPALLTSDLLVVGNGRSYLGGSRGSYTPGES